MNRVVSPLVLIILLTVTQPIRSAEKALVLNVWPGPAPGVSKPVAEERVVAQKWGNNSLKRVTDVSQPTITICQPPHQHDTGAAVLICPGGGYQSLSWDLEGEDVVKWLNSIGVTGIILKYRVPRAVDLPHGTQPIGPLQDAQRAMSVVRSRAAEWGIDPQRIGILGFSAGGHLAASAECNFDKRAYEPADQIDKVSCRPDFAVLLYPAYLLVRDKDELAPDIRVRSECPPTFIAHAGDDGLVKVENCLQLYRALKRAGVRTELHIYTSGGHGFGLRPSKNPSSTWPARCTDWLAAEHFLAKPAPAH